MKDTKPFFIISSGRSGTQMMIKIFNEFHNVEINHEYMVNIIQPIASQYYMGMITKELVCKKLRETYQSSIFYSEKEMWGDSSNKLSWIIDCFHEHLVFLLCSYNIFWQDKVTRAEVRGFC